MTGKTYNTIVLGGGLAGLSAAYHGGFAVYEARHTPGGTANSIQKEGFTFDIGIHVLQSKDPYFYYLIRKLGIDIITHKRSGWIYSYGSYSSYPFQVNTSHLPLTHRMRCILSYLMRKNNSIPKDYEEWMIQNFGMGFSKTFLIPYAEKFWGVPPREMSWEWTDERVPRPRLLDIIKGAFRDQDTNLGTHVEFHYPTKYRAGFAAIAQAMASRIETIHYGRKATAIDHIDKIISFDGGENRVGYDRLITSIPLPELIKLISFVPREIQDAVSRLRCNSIAIVNIGVDRLQVSEKHWIHFPEKEISFFRISFPSNFCEGLNPAGTSSIQAEISYNAKNRPGQKDLLKQVKEDLIKVRVLNRQDRFRVQDVLYKHYGYVIYDRFRKEAVRKIHDYLHAMNIFPCGRYGAWEYLWSDQAISSGQRAAEKVKRGQS